MSAKPVNLSHAILGLVAALMCAGISLGACARNAAPDTEVKPFSQLEPLTVVSSDSQHVFKVEIADDYNEREQGLMFRKNLPENHGMLFEFPDSAERAFWMKNTAVALDIIYISSAGKIVSIQKQAQPFNETPLPSYAPAKGVLEVQGGLSDKLGIKVGDQVIHPFFNSEP